MTAQDDATELRSFFYDVAQLPGYSMEQMMQGSPDAQMYFDAFGRDLVTKTILMSPQLSVFHERAKPFEKVKSHRHGTHQLTYVLSGELHYGNTVTKAGMGRFQPNIWYSWQAGPEGAEWLEIHAGQATVELLPSRDERAATDGEGDEADAE